jgi:Fe-S cluster assembly iron-binding protein IscA
MSITDNARSMMVSLSSTGVFRIGVTGDLIAGSHFDLFPHSVVEETDVIICDEPKVVADLFSYHQLLDKEVDYDVDTAEFIISNRS